MARRHRAVPVDKASQNTAPQETGGAFAVALPVFEGPFDLLLQLIARRELDVTEVALSQVTDEFIAYIGQAPNLSETTEFLVVAATLLEMKAASLLPTPAPDADLIDADLSARDLLFSRLLQYRAFKLMSERLGAAIDVEAGAFAREVPLEPQFAALLPELVWTATTAELAAVARELLAEPQDPTEARHVARPQVSVEEQVLFVESALRAHSSLTFEELIAPVPKMGTGGSRAGHQAVVIGRFLALLELFRRGIVSFEQAGPLKTLTVHLDESQKADAAK